MLDSINLQHKHLRQQLALLINNAAAQPEMHVERASQLVDVVITPNEINDKHGTGPLVARLFKGCSNIFSIRSRNDYGGEHSFGDESVCLSHAGLSRAEIFQAVLHALAGKTVRRVACVPYLKDDLLTAIAVKELFNVPLCMWLMDDQNIQTSNIPDDLMREFLAKCSLRLTTHPEMRNAYESKYGLKFWLLPAVVPGHLVTATATQPTGGEYEAKTGALVGSIWDRRWFEQLCATIKGSGYKVHWFGNNNSPYLRIESHELVEAGITPFGLVAEERLAALLKNYAYAIVPTGTTDDTGNALALAQLSLPGRILFVAATSNTPVVVIGGAQTPAANFVRRFQIGVSAAYDAQSFREAVEQVSTPEAQRIMRRNCAAIAPALSGHNLGDWVWRSLELGEPCDARFEDLLPRSEGDLVAFIEPPAPVDIYREYVPIYHTMRRLRGRGYRPDFVIDVGASMGIWSYAVSKIFEQARFILVDPMNSRYDKRNSEYHIGSIPNAELVEVAISNQPGEAEFHLPPDIYGGSLLHPADFRSYEAVQVQVQTIDQLANEKRLEGRGILKADVQFAEHLVLEGAREFLSQIDVIVLELSLVRFEQNAKIIPEMLQLLNSLGFRYYDDAGHWRSPVDGMLLQKDMVFVREDLPAAVIGEGLPPAAPVADKAGLSAATAPVSKTISQADVIITHNEVNDKHGVGVLTHKIFGATPNVISIRSQNHFGGEQQFGDVQLCLAHPAPTRAQVTASVRQALNGSAAGRIVCIPYYPDDVLSALALKDIFKVPLCTYIMDDQNICIDGIPDALMRELLGVSDLRLAISPELRAAYEQKYRLKFWLLPPVVTNKLIQTEPRLPGGANFKPEAGIVVGNIWGQKWMELLRATIKGAGIEVDWYCNSGLQWHNASRAELAADGINAHGGLPEAQLVPLMRNYSFAVLPSGTLDETDDRRFIAQLSLPSKVPFILATSNTPIIVLGNRETAAGRFVEHFGIGVVADYDPASLRQAAQHVSSPDIQLQMRQRAAAMAHAFAVDGIAEWIWQSLEKGEPVDRRFEELLPSL